LDGKINESKFTRFAFSLYHDKCHAIELKTAVIPVFNETKHFGIILNNLFIWDSSWDKLIYKLILSHIVIILCSIYIKFKKKRTVLSPVVGVYKYINK
jgi:hypothetical protein